MRKVIASIALSAFALTALVACSPPAQRITTTVGTDGFTISIGGVTATGDGGVAASGTVVTLEVSDQATGAELADVISPIGESISLTLGEGLQPATPIELRFDGVALKSDAGGEKAAQSVPLIVTESADGTIGLIEATQDGEQLVATTDHLTFFQPIRFDWNAALQSASDLLLESLGLQYPKPECVDKKATASNGIEYSVSHTGVTWPCISAEGDTITVDLFAATHMPYRALSSPQVTGATVPSADGQGILMTLANKWVPSPGGGTVMGGGAGARFTFDASNPPQYFDLRQDALMLIGSVLLNLLGVILNPLGGGAEFMQKVGQLDCLSGIVGAGTSPKADASTAAAIFKTTLACVGTLSGAAAYPIRLALGLIGAVPVLFTGVVMGLVNEVSGKGGERISIESHVAPWSISFDGIGPFKVGSTTWGEVEAKKGFTGTVLDDQPPAVCAAGGWQDSNTIFDGVSLLADDPDSSAPGTLDVVGINSWSRTGVAATVPASTDKGVKLGTSEQDVRKGYPGITPVPHQLSAEHLQYRIENGNNRAIVITVTNGSVSDISVGNMPEIYYPEGCY